ncbi:hypothetical protein [Actinomadura chibensis]|uniref:Uncharacterized protein n=1 Tax=Actinomadura chibensis TaxID=392828 RepID=A0A5D0NF05_9ACTN|nr:hypothetical protein [Actinomadura chibensis]TYB42889.1 hypothetical protein FXF69_29400 [Actinomadura chibensis]
MGFKVWVVVVAVLVGGAGCGGGDDGGGVASAGGAAAGGVSASPSASLSAEDSRLKFAQCMRENGVDVPDPGSGDASALRLGKGAGREKLQAALKQCQQWLQAGGKLPDMKDPKKRDQYVEFAQCMREHGVDMPDPGPDGKIRLPSEGVDRGAVEKARKACQGSLPGAGE